MSTSICAVVALMQALALSGRPVTPSAAQPPVRLDSVVANDNRVPAGRMEDGVLRVRLEARLAAWRPDLAVDTTVTVMVFAEEGRSPQIPGPLLRASHGTPIHLTLRNTLDSAIVVYGLRAGTVSPDTMHLAPGAARELRFAAGAPGTYLYWGTATGSPIHDRPWRDGQLTGAMVIDPINTVPDPAERIFVITVIDVFPSDSARNKAGEDIWDLAINGRSWPHTERLQHAVGDTVRWRWLNGSYLPHPMHLHGFHFRVTAKGDGNADSTYSPGAAREAVTEFMTAGSTFRMEWVPTRAGNWLMHCHMIPHITPFPPRPDSLSAHDLHDVRRHALDGMAGLVLGITTVDPSHPVRATTAPSRHLRVFAQQAAADSGIPARRGYVLQQGESPRPASVEVPGTPLVLTRDRTTAITVVNRSAEATTVHWHGMELESVFDGVAGWSGAGSNLAPLLAPGDSFTVAFTPPRAGTFIYHTHMDEGAQLGTGMYGALLVLEEGEAHDPVHDRTFIIGSAIVRDTVMTTLNAAREPAPLDLRAGETYRLRFINILAAEAATVELLRDTLPVSWTPLAKDGADLPAGMRVPRAARITRFGVGETHDVTWTPAEAMDVTLVVRLGPTVIRQQVRVAPAS